MKHSALKLQDSDVVSVLGFVPGDWNCHPLGELLEERVEFSADTTSYNLFSLTIEEGLVPKSERYERSFLLKDKENNQYRIVHPGDYVYNPMNLRFGAISQSSLDKSVLVSAYYNVLSLSSDKADPKFLGILLSSPKLLRHYDSIAIGSLNEKKRVHLKEFLKVTVPLPAIDEQRKIAEILSCWSDGIHAISRKLEYLEKYKSWLVRRFVDRVEFSNSEAITVKLSDVANINLEALGESTPKDFQFYYVDLSSVQTGRITYPEEQISFLGSPSRARRVVKDGDILMATVRPNLLGFAIAEATRQPTICSTGFAVIRPKQPQDTRFLYQTLYSSGVTKQINSLIVGSNYPAINASDVAGLQINYPVDNEIRSSIGALLSTVDKESFLLSSQVAALRRQKQALMQKLLTGKIRVKV